MNKPFILPINPWTCRAYWLCQQGGSRWGIEIWVLMILKIGRLVPRKEGRKEGWWKGGSRAGKKDGQNYAYLKKCICWMSNSLIPLSIDNYLWSQHSWHSPRTISEQNKHPPLLRPSIQWENFDHLLIWNDQSENDTLQKDYYTPFWKVWDKENRIAASM